MTSNRLRSSRLEKAISNRHSCYGRWGRFWAINPDPKSGRFVGRLDVYPPGTTTQTRRLLRVWGFFTDWFGIALLWVGGILTHDVDQLALAGYVSLALAAMTALYLATRRTRRETRTIALNTTRHGWFGHRAMTFLQVAYALAELEANDTGDPVAYEVAWGCIYHDLLTPLNPNEPPSEGKN